MDRSNGDPRDLSNRQFRDRSPIADTDSVEPRIRRSRATSPELRQLDEYVQAAVGRGELRRGPYVIQRLDNLDRLVATGPGSNNEGTAHNPIVIDEPSPSPSGIRVLARPRNRPLYLVPVPVRSSATRRRRTSRRRSGHGRLRSPSRGSPQRRRVFIAPSRFPSPDHSLPSTSFSNTTEPHSASSGSSRTVPFRLPNRETPQRIASDTGRSAPSRMQSTESPLSRASDTDYPNTTGSTNPNTTDSTYPNTTGSTNPNTTDSTYPNTTGSTNPNATDSTSPSTAGSVPFRLPNTELPWSRTSETRRPAPSSMPNHAQSPANTPTPFASPSRDDITISVQSFDPQGMSSNGQVVLNIPHRPSLQRIVINSNRNAPFSVTPNFDHSLPGNTSTPLSSASRDDIGPNAREGSTSAPRSMPDTSSGSVPSMDSPQGLLIDMPGPTPMILNPNHDLAGNISASMSDITIPLSTSPTTQNTTSPDSAAPPPPNTTAPTSPNIAAPTTPNTGATSPNIAAPPASNTAAPTSPNIAAPTTPNTAAPTFPNIAAPPAPNTAAPTSPNIVAPTIPNTTAQTYTNAAAPPSQYSASPFRSTSQAGPIHPTPFSDLNNAFHQQFVQRVNHVGPFHTPPPSDLHERQHRQLVRQFNNVRQMRRSVSDLVTTVRQMRRTVSSLVMDVMQRNRNSRLDRLAPAHPYRNGEAIECCICLDGIQKEQEIRQLPCQHAMHKECIDQWFLERNSCPYCRADYPHPQV